MSGREAIQAVYAERLRAIERASRRVKHCNSLFMSTNIWAAESALDNAKKEVEAELANILKHYPDAAQQPPAQAVTE